MVFISGEGECTNNFGMRTIDLEQIHREWGGMAEEMKGERTCVVFGESSKVRMTIGMKLVSISN